VALCFCVRSDCVVTLRASRSFQSPQKTNHFLTTEKSAGGVGGAGKKWKGNGLVFVPPLRPPKSSVSISIFLESFPLRFFPSLRRARRAPSPRLVVIRASAHTSQAPRIGRSHSFAMPARCCFVFALWLRSILTQAKTSYARFCAM